MGGVGRKERKRKRKREEGKILRMVQGCRTEKVMVRNRAETRSENIHTPNCLLSRHSPAESFQDEYVP